jgi:hypothetical protein
MKNAGALLGHNLLDRSICSFTSGRAGRAKLVVGEQSCPVTRLSVSQTIGQSQTVDQTKLTNGSGQSPEPGPIPGVQLPQGT